MTQLISCDDHLDLPYLPADLWQTRLPVAMREDGPKVVDTDEGPFWFFGGARRNAYGRKPGLIDSFARAGLPVEPEPGRYRPATPEYRLADMTDDGIQASVIFLPGSVGGKVSVIADPALRLASLRALNDWAIEDFAAAAPDRLVPLAELPAEDPAAAAAEVRRVAAKGYRGVTTTADVTPSIIDDAWEPLWAAIAETGLVLNIHLGGATHTLRAGNGPDGWLMAPFTSVIHMQMDEVIAGLIFAGVLERHPGLRVVMAECGIGWVPYVLDMMDFMQEEWLPLKGDRGLTMKASDYFRRQMFVTFEQEKTGPKLIPDIGVDNVMWASDYPHGISTFPHSQKTVDEMLAVLDEDDRRKVVHDNAAALYGLATAAGADR